MTSYTSQSVDTFAPMGATSQVSVTQTSQAFVLPSTAGATAPCLIVVSLQASIQNLFIKFGTSAAVTVSSADGMKVGPGSSATPTILSIPAGATHIAIICEGPPGTVALTGADAQLSTFAPNGASVDITVTSASQAFVIPATGTGSPAISFVGLQSTQIAWFIKFGTSGAVTVSRTDGFKLSPGAASDPRVLAIPTGSTHFAILCEGADGSVRVTGGVMRAGTPSGSITNPMLANMANGTVKGRGTAGTGVPEDIPVANGLLIDATSLRTRQQMSVDADASGLKLVNDATAPGNSKYYGTDTGGVRGFFTFPSAVVQIATATTSAGSVIGMLNLPSTGRKMWLFVAQNVQHNGAGGSPQNLRIGLSDNNGVSFPGGDRIIGTALNTGIGCNLMCWVLKLDVGSNFVVQSSGVGNGYNESAITTPNAVRFTWHLGGVFQAGDITAYAM